MVNSFRKKTVVVVTNFKCCSNFAFGYVASTRMSCNTNEKELDCGKSSQAVIIFVPRKVFWSFPPFGDASSSQLPDYFTAVQNIPEVSSQPNEELWTEDIDGSADENEQPPCYEQALTMSGLSASEADLENQAG